MLHSGAKGTLFSARFDAGYAQLATKYRVQYKVKDKSWFAKRRIRLGTYLSCDFIPTTLVSSLKEHLMHKERSVVLLLDHLTNQGNFGAILRSAYYFGVDLVIHPKSESVGNTKARVESSTGAFSQVPRYIANIHQAISQLKELGFWIYALDMEGNDIRSVQFSEKIALVVGSEDKGLSHLTKQKSDTLVSIVGKRERIASGVLDSLNASVATGIACYVACADMYKKK